MHNMSAMMSSDNQCWNTPESLLAIIRRFAGGTIALDPSTDSSNPCKAEKFYTTDALTNDWKGPGLAFSNPPYGRGIVAWARKFAIEGRTRELLTLVPARTDTLWWQDHMIKAQAICFWKGRITFVGAQAPAPFPSALVYWGNRADIFQQMFSPFGWIVPGKGY